LGGHIFVQNMLKKKAYENTWRTGCQLKSY